MKRYILILITLFFVLTASSQIKQDIIASAGGYNVAAGISISWTLGETIIPTFTSSDNTLILTHGFQQQLILTSVEENLEVLVTVTVYPNPAADNINVRFEEPLVEEISLTIISSTGKPVKTLVIEATTLEKQINLQDLAAGVYYLKLTKGKLSNVYKVVKL